MYLPYVVRIRYAVHLRRHRISREPVQIRVHRTPPPKPSCLAGIYGLRRAVPTSISISNSRHKSSIFKTRILKVEACGGRVVIWVTSQGQQDVLIRNKQFCRSYFAMQK